MADDTKTTENEEEAADDAAGSSKPAEVRDGDLKPVPSVLERLNALPDTVRDYLLSDELAATHKRIFDQHKVSEDDRDVVYYTELQTFFGEIPAADFPDKMWVRLEWPDDKEDAAVALANDILGFVFLPAQAHLGDVAGVLADLGGDVTKYPEKQLEMRRVAYMEGAKEIADGAGLAGLGEDMRKRLAHIIESRLRSVRDDGDTKEMLMKSKKTGGMELSEEDADRVLGVLASKMRMTAFVEAVDTAKPEADTAPEAPAEGTAKQYSAIEIKNVYSGTAEEQEALKKRVNRFAQVTEGDAGKMRDAYYQILYPPDGRPTDPLYVVAGLIGMAQGDRFSEAVESDDRYKEVLRQFMRGKGMEADIADYEEDPIAPRYMNMLLQFLLRGIAGLDEATSARFGLRVINALKKQGYDRYADLVAFDMDKGAFAWKETIEP